MHDLYRKPREIDDHSYNSLEFQDELQRQNLSTPTLDGELALLIFSAIKNADAEADRNTPLRKIARELGISTNYLYKIFKQATGVPPRQYVNQLKVEVAIHLIQNTDMLFKEVCYRAGFHHRQTMYQAIKKATGLSSAELRSQAGRKQHGP